MDVTTSLTKGRQILEFVSRSAEPVTVRGIALGTGLSKSTAHRLASQLEERGALEAEPGGYRLGLQLFELGGVALRRHRLEDAARPIMESLYDQTHRLTQQGASRHRRHVPGESGTSGTPASGVSSGWTDTRYVHSPWEGTVGAQPGGYRGRDSVRHGPAYSSFHHSSGGTSKPTRPSAPCRLRFRVPRGSHRVGMRCESSDDRKECRCGDLDHRAPPTHSIRSCQLVVFERPLAAIQSAGRTRIGNPGRTTRSGISCRPAS
jgi:hypothetical protein